jgi:ChaB
MPYQMNSELPSSVKSHLPNHAQDIYREAFNHARRSAGRGGASDRLGCGEALVCQGGKYLDTALAVRGKI